MEQASPPEFYRRFPPYPNVEKMGRQRPPHKMRLVAKLDSQTFKKTRFVQSIL